MSRQDHINAFTTALNNYKGLTRLEKDYCLENIEDYINEDGSINGLIEKLEKRDLNIKSFLEEYESKQ